MDTWRGLIETAMGMNEEGFEDILVLIPADFDLDKEFDSGWGGGDNRAFTVWTERRVYFPTGDDGGRHCSSVPRDPCDEICDLTL